MGLNRVDVERIWQAMAHEHAPAKRVTHVPFPEAIASTGDWRLSHVLAWLRIEHGV